MSPEMQQIYLKKRELILKILSSLIDDWEEAEGLYVLIGSTFVTPEIIDSLMESFLEASKNIKDIRIKAKINNGILAIKHMQELETKEHEEDKKLASLQAIIF